MSTKRNDGTFYRRALRTMDQLPALVHLFTAFIFTCLSNGREPGAAVDSLQKNVLEI